MGTRSAVARFAATALAAALGLGAVTAGAAHADPAGRIEITDDPGRYDAQLGTSRTVGWAVRNTGDVPVSVPAPATVTGADWSLVLTDQPNDCGEEVTVLAPGELCGLNVRFTPTALGDRPGRLTLDSDAAGSPQVRELRGSGLPYDALTLDPASLDFGSATVSTTTTAQHVLVRNDSPSPTVIRPPHVTGPFTTRGLFGCFDEYPGETYTLRPGESCDYIVSFRPTGEGPATGQFVVDTDDGHGSEVTALSGTGTPTGPVPAITGVTPASGPGGTLVRLQGTNLNATSVAVGGGREVPFSAAANGRSLSLRMPANGPYAYRTEIRLRTASGIERTVPFDYTPQPAPTITGITPDRGSTGADTTVTLAGTGFFGVQAVDVAGAGGLPATANAAGTSLRLRVPAGLEPGPHEVRVYTDSGPSAPVVFTVLARPAPVITAVTPASGPARGNTAVQVTGTDLAGASVTVDGTPVAATVNRPGTTLTFRTPAHAAGAVPVVVTTLTGTTTTGFTYVQPAPTITAVSPAAGPARGGTAVRITGTDLTGAAVTVDGRAVAATVNAAGTAATFRTPPHAAGAVAVVVTTPAGSATTGYTYR